MFANSPLSLKLVRSTSIVLALVMLIGIIWHIYREKNQAQLELLEQSRVLAAQVLAMRQVIAENQHKINYDSQGNFEFKHLNPAVITSKVSHVFNDNTEYVIKLISLKPRVPSHYPDSFEKEKLLIFQNNTDEQEAWGENVVNGERYFRFIIPMRIEAACLTCHGEPKGEIDISGNVKEGYKTGDLAGALSISIPTKIKDVSLINSILQNVILTILVVVFSATVIIFHTNLFVTKPINSLVVFSKKLARGQLEAAPTEVKTYGEIRELTNNFREMASNLKEMYDKLEQKVEERTQRLTEANQELIKVSKYKSEFLANMSHELRTPLTAIMAFSDELLKENQGSLLAEQVEYLEEIKDSGTQLLGLINDLLDLSKIESGKMALNLSEVDIAEAVTQNLKVIKPLAYKKELDIKLNFARTEMVIADAQKVAHVVRNLLGNAVKFSSIGQTIELSVYPATGPEEGVFLKVQDFGPGISSEEKELIFDLFYQGEKGLSRNYSGTGLGLALVHKIVTLHLGWVKVDSTLGEGATFYVFWPTYPPFDSELD